MTPPRWLSVRLETLGALAALLSGVVAVEQRGSAGALGLLLTYALQMTQFVGITLRLGSAAEAMLNSGVWGGRAVCVCGGGASMGQGVPKQGYPLPIDHGC